MPDPIDRQAVRELQEQLGREGFAGLATAFLDRTPDRLVMLRAAALAGDAAKVREQAHSLRGSARTFGGAELGDLAGRVEDEAARGSLAQVPDLLAELDASFERTRTVLESELRNGAGADRCIRVLLADDDPVVRELLSALVDTEPSFELVGAAADADRAIELAAAAHPDVALLDLDMPGGGGWRAIEEIRDRCPETQSIVLTALDTPEDQLHTMRSGAVDFLSKGASKRDIVDAVRSAVRWRSGQPEPTAEQPPATPEERIAALERRVAALEQAISRSSG